MIYKATEMNESGFGHVANLSFLCHLCSALVANKVLIINKLY